MLKVCASNEKQKVECLYIQPDLDAILPGPKE